METGFYRGSNVAQLMARMEKRWQAILHHAGNGSRLHDSRCMARIYSDGLRAVVLLTELDGNQGTSVTNAYEIIAQDLRTAVQQFIPEENFPGSVAWLEQYEARADDVSLVALRWAGKRCLSPPAWKHVTQGLIAGLGLDWKEVINVPK